MHELKVMGATRSIHNNTMVYRGEFSEPHRILLKKNCDQVGFLLEDTQTSCTIVPKCQESHVLLTFMHLFFPVRVRSRPLPSCALRKASWGSS